MRKPTQEELRRAPRVRVCCRVDVRQPFGVWSAVTADLSTRGCRIVTRQLPRLGSRLPLLLSSDVLAEDLYTMGEVVWVSGDQLGLLFLETARRSASTSAAEWVRQVLALGKADAPEAPSGAASTPQRVVPAVSNGAPKLSAIPIHSRRHSG
jgi:PilZ domain